MAKPATKGVPMSETYGKSPKWWLDMRNSTGVGLPEALHRCFDRNTDSSDPRIAFLAGLISKDRKDVKQIPDRLIVLGTGALDYLDDFLKGGVETITKKHHAITRKHHGWEVLFHSGVKVLLDRPLPEEFKRVTAFFTHKVTASKKPAAKIASVTKKPAKKDVKVDPLKEIETASAFKVAEFKNLWEELANGLARAAFKEKKNGTAACRYYKGGKWSLQS